MGLQGSLQINTYPNPDEPGDSPQTDREGPELGEDAAVFHTRQYCLRDARGYGEVWAQPVPGRVPKFPGCLAAEEYVSLLDALEESGGIADGGIPVVLHLGGRLVRRRGHELLDAGGVGAVLRRAGAAAGGASARHLVRAHRRLSAWR